MSDKKVERNVRSSEQERPSTPTQKMTGSLSDGGTVNVAEARRDKGKGALLDRFRERDEAYRLAQSMNDRTAAALSTDHAESDSSQSEEAGIDDGHGASTDVPPDAEEAP